MPRLRLYIRSALQACSGTRQGAGAREPGALGAEGREEHSRKFGLGTRVVYLGLGMRGGWGGGWTSGPPKEMNGTLFLAHSWRRC